MHPSPTPPSLPWSVRWRLARRNAEHRVRNVLLALLRRVLVSGANAGASSVESASADEHRASSVHRLLLVRTGRAIGDMVMALALLPESRRLFPGARVECLMRENLAPFFQEGSGADEILTFSSRVLWKPLDTFRLLRTLRARRYDLVVACDTPHKSSMTTLCFSLWTGAPVRVGFDNVESRPFLTRTVAAAPGEPMLENLRRLLSPFGTTAPLAPKLVPSETSRRAAAAFFGGGPAPVIIFAPSHWRKSWPLAAFLRMAGALTARGQRVFLAFGPGDARLDDSSVHEWIANSQGLGVALPPQSPSVWMAMLAGCALFISNDCGPYHLAVAAGARCIAAFLSEDARRDFGYQETGRLAAIHRASPQEMEAEVVATALVWLAE